MKTNSSRPVLDKGNSKVAFGFIKFDVMRIRFKHILMVLLLLGQFSCNSWLDLYPPSDLIREEYWQTKEDVEAVVMGSYRSLASLNQRLFYYGEARADMITDGTYVDQSVLKMMEGSIYADNYLTNWQDFYATINYCNEVIANAQAVREIDLTFTELSCQSLISEATFIRALTYFYLVRTFNNVPLVTEPSESDGVDFYVTQTPGDSIIAFLREDLKKVRNQFDDSYITTAETKGRASKLACNALLADMALWAEDYADALDCIALIETDEHLELMPSGKWFEIFYPGNSLESIFELQFDQNEGLSSSLAGMTNEEANSILPSSAAIQLFAREYSTEFFRGEELSIRKISEGNYRIWKYWGSVGDGRTTRPGTESSSANWIIYRLADIKLMKAEALSQKSGATLADFTEAISLVNEIRDRAGVAAVSTPSTALACEDLIMAERALELAFEGKRWFDIVRMGRRNNFARKDKAIELIVSSVPSAQKRILSTKLSNTNGWYLPVYKYELERNKYLVQNPYYNN